MTREQKVVIKTILLIVGVVMILGTHRYITMNIDNSGDPAGIHFTTDHPWVWWYSAVPFLGSVIILFAFLIDTNKNNTNEKE